MYIPSTAVCISELLKCIISIFFLIIVDRGKMKDIGESLLNTKGNWRVLVPSALYVAQNNLQYLAASNLPVHFYQVFIQFKVITTAFFSQVLLERRHSRVQWLSLFILSFGLGLVQLSLQATAKVQAIVGNIYIGVAAVVLSCLTSGFAGVYLEKIVKSTNNTTSLWNLNTKMSAISFFMAAAAALAKHYVAFSQGNPVRGYNSLVMSVIALQAVGGIIVAIVVKKTNSVVKGFATSGSVLVSCLASMVLFRNDFKLSPLFVLGASIVCGSAILFSKASLSLSSSFTNGTSALGPPAPTK